ncbi:MAG: hypothetical protein VCD00_01930 [Candidatus Hydrogenedentota bacterium]
MKEFRSSIVGHTLYFVLATFLCCLSSPTVYCAEPVVEAESILPEMVPDTSPCTFRSVVASGCLSLEVDGVTQNIMLYGVDVTGLSVSERKIARDFLKEQVKSTTLRFRIEREFGGLSYARFYAPHDVAAEMIAAGVIPWDRFLAPDDAAYQALEKEAEEAGLGLWRRGSNKLARAEGSKKNQERKSTLNDRRLVIPGHAAIPYREIVDALRFDAMAERWSELTSETRANYRNNTNRVFAERSSRTDSAVSQLSNSRTKLSDRQRQLDDDVRLNSENITKSYQSERDRISRVKPPAQNYSTGNSRIIRGPSRTIMVSTRGNYDVILNTTSSGRRPQVSNEALRISAQEQARRNEYSAQISALELQGRKIAGQQKYIEGRQEALTANARSRTSRTQNKNLLFDRLDAAIKNGIPAGYRFKELEWHSLGADDESLQVRAKERFLVVGWDFPQGITRPNTRVDVYRDGDSYPRTSFFEDPPYYQREFVFEPGHDYMFKAKSLAENSPCELRVRYITLETLREEYADH